MLYDLTVPAYQNGLRALSGELSKAGLWGADNGIGELQFAVARLAPDMFPLASQIRFRNVVENYQTTSHAAEALYRLTESSLALGIPAEAKKYAAVLGANYPGSKWYERAYTLIGDEAPQLIGTGG